MAGEDDKVIEIDLERDLVDLAVRKIRQTFRVGLMAIVQTFDRATSRAGVEFGTKYLDMARGVRDEPPVSDLPVLLPRCGGYGIYGDLSEGDLGLVVALDGPTRGLFETGDPVVPQFTQGHDFGCGVFAPCGRVSSSETPTDPPNNPGEWHVGADDSSAAVVFRKAGGPSPDEIGTVAVLAAGPTASVLLGSITVVIPVACATQVSANLDTMNTAVQSIPETRAPEPIAAMVAVKAAFSAAFNLFVGIADAKARVDGPAGP